MGQDTEAIRRQVGETRDEMSGTVDARGNKADVKDRAKGTIQERRDAVVGKLSGAGGRVSESTLSGSDVKEGAQRAASTAQENPLGLGIGAIAAGFLAGMLIPSTRTENERIGPVADEVKDRAREAGQQALEHGKEAAQEIAQSASEQTKEAAKSTAQEAGEAARQQAGQATR